MVIYPIHPRVLELLTIAILDSEAICEHDADVISRCAGSKILPDVDAANILMQFKLSIFFIKLTAGRYVLYATNVL